ncbi:MAG: hypothetical protein ACO3ZY_12500 [Phycisphaerales bacterium]
MAPPFDPDERLRLVLRLVPLRHREDAEQEASLARLEGRSPWLAVDAWRRRVLRRESREIAASDWLDRMRDRQVWREPGPDRRADPRGGAA